MYSVKRGGPSLALGEAYAAGVTVFLVTLYLANKSYYTDGEFSYADQAMTHSRLIEPRPQPPGTHAYVIVDDPFKVIEAVPLERLPNGLTALSGTALRECLDRIDPTMPVTIYVPDQHHRATQPVVVTKPAATIEPYTFFDGAIKIHGHQAYLHNEPVHLSGRVFDLVAYLGKTPGVVRPHSDILRKVWSDRYPNIGMSSLYVGISKAREVLGYAAILSYSDQGYAAQE